MQRFRKSMEFKSQVLAMKEAGHGFKTIARALSISKNTVKRICEDGAPSADKAKAEKAGAADAAAPAWTESVGWEEIVHEVRAGVTLKQLHKEHAPRVGYTGFRRHVRKLCVSAPRVSIPMLHKAGEKSQVDYTDGIDIFPEGASVLIRIGMRGFPGDSAFAA